MSSPKPPTTYLEQIALLRSRGLSIDNEEDAVEILSQVNYYRLVAYCLPFKQSDGNYVPGTPFSRIYRLYEFDRKLRGILFSALEDVEVTLRARLTYYHAHKYGSVGYLEPSIYRPKHDHEKFIENLHREIESNKNALFVKHHLERYDGIFPIWVAFEIFTFGMLSRFFSDLPEEDQKHIARDRYCTTSGTMRSWLRCCTDLRNICAHYGRLYFRIFPAVPAGLSVSEYQKTRLWGAILALKGSYIDVKKWNEEVVPSLVELFETYSDAIELRHLAFPVDWKERLYK